MWRDKTAMMYIRSGVQFRESSRVLSAYEKIKTASSTSSRVTLFNRKRFPKLDPNFVPFHDE